MPPFRMPFGRKPQAVNGLMVSENQPPSVTVDTPYGEKSASSAIVIKPKKSEPEEFKLGMVDGNGAFLPPSPPERKSMWRRTPTSTTTSSHASVLSDNDGFSISRESFDSYRRSFDISASSPVIHPESMYSRQSLDSVRTPYTPRSLRQNSGRSFDSPRQKDVNTVDEEDTDVFEEVGLEDKPQRKGIFSRFMKEDGQESTSRPSSGHRGFHLPGRKRGQSGQGAELGDMPMPVSNMGPTEQMTEDKSAQIKV